MVTMEGKNTVASGGSVIQGLTDKMVQVRLNSIDVSDFLFATYFPLKRVNSGYWHVLSNQTGSKNVAADIHDLNSSTVTKVRKGHDSMSGRLPRIAIKREMDAATIIEYKTALALAGDDDAAKLVQYWGNDIDFCFNGVQSELEYLAWAVVSNGGYLDINQTNNATLIADNGLDYHVDDEQKVTADSDWTNKATADIIGDLANIIQTAKGAGFNPKFAFVSQEQFYKIASSEQMIKACASYLANAVGMAQTPNLESVNNAFANQAWLNGLQLRVIDQTITREYSDGSTSSSNPFADNRMVLAESETLGSTQYAPILTTNDTALHAERSHTVITRYSVADPVKDITIGETLALPILDSAYRNVYIRTDNTNWV